MAELARIAARPRLLPPLGRPVRASTTMSSLYLGLGLGYSRSISSTMACQASRAGFRQGGTHTTRRERERERMADIHGTSTFLLPFTVVPPPIWRFPFSPPKFCKMVYLLAKNRLLAFMSLVGVYFMSSREGGWRRPSFRTGKRAAVPTAKALHLQMSEAVASGDRDTLRRICTSELFQVLAGAIDGRPRGVRTEWELVRYEHTLRYPRIADFRVTYQPHPVTKSMRLIKQVVVSIASVQRLTRYDDNKGGEKVPGSDRERHMLEHIVLQSMVKDRTYESGPWLIWGTLSEMPYETIEEDTRMLNSMMDSKPM